MALKAKSNLAGAVVGSPDDKLVIVTTKGGGRLAKFDEAAKRGRTARGATVIALKPGDAVEGLVALVGKFEMPVVLETGKKVKQKTAVAGRAKRK
jgi:DNA gyrase/topoisomerase IV subunit A